ncbi:hypothetical protein [Tenacibaculum soleae]|uniref:Uncharacterized protein n=1 Tax=Tenacibaculum soleae TaxID=447689 RepID=A0A1B9Y1T1_9FLAO|nr:hypothetical protein [Tenacibaculum soleae]MDO6744246.1 hypothetical protein [Tenacibaculum soleae]MDO6812637.1 hypothetical protein [Tenacibaculum soleae]OCK43763.1 hypothetical protein BA195_03425 [Tenacibaculum soleae]
MKPKIALFFTILFVGIIITPTVVSLIDKNQDITIFFELNEEEENKGQKAIKIFALKTQVNEYNTSIFFKNIQKKKNVRFKSKNYISEFSKILTPPPELL